MFRNVDWDCVTQKGSQNRGTNHDLKSRFQLGLVVRFCEEAAGWRGNLMILIKSWKGAYESLRNVDWDCFTQKGSQNRGTNHDLKSRFQLGLVVRFCEEAAGWRGNLIRLSKSRKNNPTSNSSLKSLLPFYLSKINQVYPIKGKMFKVKECLVAF